MTRLPPEQPGPGRLPVPADADAAFLDAALRWVEWRLRKAAPGSAEAGQEVWVPDHEAELARAQQAYAEAATRRPSFLDLVERLHLTRFEAELLLLCLAAELSPHVADLCGRARHSPGAYLSLAVAREAFPESFAWDALSPERPLRRARLIEIHQPPGRALLTCPLRCEERVFHYARGARDLDDRLTAWLEPFRPPPWAGALPPSHRRVAEAVAEALQRFSPGDVLPAVQLVGPDRLGKEMIAYEAAASWGRALYRGAAEALPGSLAELDAVARVWERECRLMRLALYLDAEELDPPGSAAAAEPAASPGGGPAAPAAQAVLRLAARTHRVVFLGVSERWPLGAAGRDSITFDVGRPAPDEQEEAWVEALGGSPEAEEVAAVLAGQFDLNTAAVRRVARAAPHPPGGRHEVRRWEHLLWDACRREVRPRLEALAAHLDPRADWERLVLPDLPRAQLRQIADQVRYRDVVYRRWGVSDRVSRGLGLSVLFAGESGTGKTLAAEVLAHALRLDLYVIDLSAVVSKYIGETEKNLRRLFDAAEEGGCVLLFDEADALFGQRSQVKESHDRYANIEIDYLLQRVESFRGLAILTTNRKSALDQAFLRRLRFVVDFPFPDAAQRARIWQTLLPPTPNDVSLEELLGAMFAALSGRRHGPPKIIPTEDLDYTFLGQFPLSGGSAFNASLNAMFLAAAERSAVGMKHVLPAIKAELTKEQKPYRDSAFVWPPLAPTAPPPARRPAAAAPAGGAKS
jgi:predicted nucleic acid-binding protein